MYFVPDNKISKCFYLILVKHATIAIKWFIEQKQKNIYFTTQIFA